MPRLPQPPHEYPEVKRLRQAHRDRRAAKAKAKASTAVPPSALPLPAVDQKLLQLRSELAIILEKPEEEVRLIKQKDGLYDPIDGLMIMSDKNRHDAAEDLRIICERYADVREKLLCIQFDGQGSRPDSKGCDLPTLVEIMMLSPSRQAAAIRRLAAVTLCRVLGGDTGLARQIFDINRVQEHLRENKIPHPARVYGQYVEEQQQGSSPVASTSFAPKQPVVVALPEPFLDWQNDLGALRKEIPAAKAALKLLFEIEIAAGVFSKNTKLNLNQPQIQYRVLAESALSSSKASIQTRIDTIAARNNITVTGGQGEGRCHHHPAQKRPREQEEDVDDNDDSILKVSEVMFTAAVWEPVWKPYMSDLSNRMLQLKSHNTDGAFSERRHSSPFGLVHKYKKPEDWPMAHQALRDTKSLYEKRVRELLEDAFVRAGTYDQTLSLACSETARCLASQLRLDVV